MAKRVSSKRKNQLEKQIKRTKKMQRELKKQGVIPPVKGAIKKKGK